MITINKIYIKAEVRKKMEEMVEKVHPSTKKEDLKAKVKDELSNGYPNYYLSKWDCHKNYVFSKT